MPILGLSSQTTGNFSPVFFESSVAMLWEV